MAIATTHPNVTTTAAPLCGTPAAGFGKNAVEILVLTADSTIYVGGPDVTTSNGRPLTTANGAWSLESEHAVWAVAASTISVCVTVVPVSQ